MPSTDSWKTDNIALEGGTIQNEGPIEQGSRRPGSLIQGTNFEPSIKGGYRRISGTVRYSSTVVPNSGQILGTFVFNNGVVAMRGVDVFYGTGTTWSNISGANTRSSVTKYQAHRYNYSQPSIIICDGVNKPATYKADGTYTQITDSNCPAADFACSFKRHMFLAKKNSNLLTFSAPAAETDYSALDGAGSINVGFNITCGMAVWRDQLFVFGDNNIACITGTNQTDWTLTPISSSIGCVAYETLAEIGGDLIFLSTDGVRTVAGTMRIGDVDLSNLSRTIQPKLIDFITNYKATGNFAGCIIRSKAQYRVFANTASTQTNAAQGFLGGIRLGLDGSVGWEWFDISGLNIYCADSNYLNSDKELIVFANNSSTDGYVYQMDTGSNFIDVSNNPVLIPAQFQLAHNPLNDPAIRKTIYRIKGYFESEGVSVIYANVILDASQSNILQPSTIYFGTLIGTFKYDDPLSTYDSYAVYDGNPISTQEAQGIGSGKLISVGFSSLGGSPYIVKSVYLEYAINGRR